MAAKKNNVYSMIEVRESKIQGKGVYAKKRIRKGQRIIEYTGELISQEEVDRRYDDDAMERHHTFLFEIDENVTIDATHCGSDARWINHSCDPNCEALDEDGRIWIFAKKNIQPGQELAYDYQYDVDEPLTPELKAQYPCYCGAKKCRGTILKPKPPRRKKKKKAKEKKSGTR